VRRVQKVTGPRARPSNKRPTVAAVIKDYLPALGTVGVALYGLLRLSYLFFYLRLRTTPEEVGYDYSRILAQSIGGAVELVLICAVAFALITSTFSATRRVLRRMSSLRTTAREIPRHSSRRIVVHSLGAALVFVLLSLPVLASWQGGLARDGQTVRNVYFVGVPYLPVLPVQAVPADVTWVDGDAGKAMPLISRTCLMYLGEANGAAVFYDVRSHESLRLPTSSITVSLRYTFFVPDSCRVH